MRVSSKISDDPAVTVARAYRRPRIPLRGALKAGGLNELDGVSPYLLPRDPVWRASDVVHGHALQGDWFSYPAMRLLARSKPVVLTLHDMWPMTGHCSFSLDCERWRSGCGSCPYPDTYPPISRDATRVEWRLKRWTWEGAAPTVVCPSEWMAGLARQGMLGQCRIEVIPHGIDLDTYSPSSDREADRRVLGIPPDRAAILFAAASVDDPRKGSDTLIRLARELTTVKSSLCLVVLGGGDGSLARVLRGMGHLVVELGFVADDVAKARVFSAADLFCFPTRADNSPLVILESLACGTPTVSFDLGGINELVRDGVTGVLVPEGSLDAMTAAVRQLLGRAETLAGYRSRCREMTERNHQPDVAARRHIALYQDAVRDHRRHRA